MKKNKNGFNKGHKLIIFIFIFITNIYLLSLIGKNQLENKLIRFIKIKKKDNLKKHNYEKDIPEIKKYVKLLREGYFKSDIYHYVNFKPKISFIATVHNKEKYLNSFICSIQYQNLKEFELIMVDDYSTDKSVDIINNFVKKDKRIKIIMNKKNMGSLYSRYKGAIFSKGKYIIFVDSDDIILKEGISNSYDYINKKNLDMIQFNSVLEVNQHKSYINRRCYKYSIIIYQPILSYIYYYDKNNGIENNSNLWDKLIKRQIVLKSLKYIGINYLHKKIIIENDVIILFSLFRNSNSFKYIDELGYYYFKENKDSITNTRNSPFKANQIIYSIFCNIEFLYDKTENNKFSKYFCLFKFIQGFDKYKNCFHYSNNNTFNFVFQIINKLLNSNFISLKNKKMIKDISNKINISSI